MGNKKTGINIKKKWKEEAGMMTVEASAIVPLLTIIIVILLFFLLFLLDMTAAKGEVIRLADETASAWKTDGELTTGAYQGEKLLSRRVSFLLSSKRGSLEGKARRRLTKRLSKRLTVSTVKKCKVKIRNGRVTVSVSLGFTIPFGIGKEYTGMSRWYFSCKQKADINNEEEWLRDKAAEQLDKAESKKR